MFGCIDAFAEANGGVEVAVDVIGRHRLGVGPLVAGFLQLTDVGPIRLAEHPLEHGGPVVHEQSKKNRDVLEVGFVVGQFLLPGVADAGVVVESGGDVRQKAVTQQVESLADPVAIGECHWN